MMKEKISSLKKLRYRKITSCAVKRRHYHLQFRCIQDNKRRNGGRPGYKNAGKKIEDGKVQAHGEDVKKVLIDGKSDSGVYPDAVLNNLGGKNEIENRDVYDKKSDPTEWTVFNDGNTSKTRKISLTSSLFRNGIFGRAFGGYGTEEKWKSGLSLNFFKDKRKLTILGNANNISEQNFSTDDFMGVCGNFWKQQAKGRWTTRRWWQWKISARQ